MEVQAQKLLLKPFQEVLTWDEVWDHAMKKGVLVHDNGFCWEENITAYFSFVFLTPEQHSTENTKGDGQEFSGI